MSKKVTICIPHFETPDLIRLCLRSIRKYTEGTYDVIVVDNDSNQESLDYLRSLSWITLIERPGEIKTQGGWAHGTALDMALDRCVTDYFLAMHSDTIILRHGWPSYFLMRAENKGQAACVGSGKLENRSAWYEAVRKATDYRTVMRMLFRDQAKIERFRYFNRTYCCLYHTETIKNEKLHFMMGYDQGMGVGKRLYYELVGRGYPTVALSPAKLGSYMVHLAHATKSCTRL